MIEGGTSSFAYSLWATGNNFSGQLGLGSAAGSAVVTPQLVAGRVISVSAGSSHAMYVDSSFDLWAVGNNSNGQLNDGTKLDKNKAVIVARDVRSVSCGFQTSFFVKGDGSLWGVGLNDEGQLGLNSTEAVTLAAKISTDVVAVSAGLRHTLFLKRDGSLWGMGKNNAGQLGVVNTDSIRRVTPILIANNVLSMAAGSEITIFLKKDGTLVRTGLGSVNQIDSNVSSIAAGLESYAYIKSNGTLWVRGRLSDNNNFAVPTQIDSDVELVSIGGFLSYAKKDGTIWAMGRDTWGGLGNGTRSKEEVVPVKLGITGAAQLSASGSAYFIIKEPRLFSLAVRTTLAADQIVIVGFTMTGGPKNVLLRAAGPSLAAFGLGNAMLNPKLEIYDGPVKVAQNDNWGGSTALLSAFQSVGAFGFSSPSSQDAAVMTSIEGSRTMHVSGPTGGIVLVEGYDLGEGDTARFAGLSARNNVGTGANILIAGFTLKGSGVANLLIRAIGPSLQAVGIQNFLQDPKLEIYSGESLIASNDNWVRDPAYNTIGFSLFNNSKDSVAPVWLPAGAYTAHVSGVNGSVGDCVIEVLEIR